MWYLAGGQILTECIGGNVFGKKATAQCCLYLAAQHPGVAARDVDMLLGVCHAAGKLLPAIDVLHFVQKKIAFLVTQLTLH